MLNQRSVSDLHDRDPVQALTISANVIIMSAMNNVTTVLFCIAATAATYLGMHLLVAPRLQPAAIDVPVLNGLSPDQARGLTDPRGLMLVLDGERAPDDEKTAPGTLFDQNPLGGSRLHPGEKVHASIARPVPLPHVPVLLGQTADAARQALSAEGLRAGTITEVPSTTVPPGQVVSTSPAGGAAVHKGDAVDLTVAKNDQVAVPSVRGKSPGSARQLLEQAGLVLGEQRHGVDDNAGDGVVLKQTPAAGTLLPRGQKVDIVVNE